jgi:tRNA modification GTPase
VLLVRSQIDRLGPADAESPGELRVSAVRGDGLAELEAAVADALGLTGERSPGSAGREMGERHLAALRASRDALDDTLRRLDEGAPLDLVAEGLRGACDALDAIDGRTSAEDVLGRIFERFCIGK